MAGAIWDLPLILENLREIDSQIPEAKLSNCRIKETKMNETNLPRRDYSDLWNRPGFLIRRLHQVHVSMFLSECKEFKITPVQFGVLTVLYKDKMLDQVSIATDLGVDRNTVADVIRRLQRRGLLLRPPSLTDKRTKLAQLTEKGQEFVEAVQPAMIRAQRRFTKSLTRDEQDQLMDLLRKLTRATNDAGRAPMRRL